MHVVYDTREDLVKIISFVGSIVSFVHVVL